jgi:capsular polysaccharide biosynthesis protein
MELREYWRIFRRRAWIPALLLIVTVATTTALIFLSKPQYIATATVLVKNSTAGATAAVAFPSVVSGNSLALQVIKELNLNQSVADLGSRIKVASTASNLYGISVTDRNPDVATALANQVAKDAIAIYLKLATTGSTTSPVFLDLQKALSDYRDTFNTAQRALETFTVQHADVVAGRSTNIDLLTQYALLQLDAQVAHDAYAGAITNATTNNVTSLSGAQNFEATITDPAAARPDTSGRLLKIGYAGALALILGVGLIFLLEYLDNSVREPEAVEELVGAPVVGIIPRATSRTLRPAKGAA